MVTFSLKEREKKMIIDANASKNDANALQTECKSNAIKESKVNEIKEKESNITLQDKNKEKFERYEKTFFLKE